MKHVQKPPILSRFHLKTVYTQMFSDCKGKWPMFLCFEISRTKHERPSHSKCMFVTVVLLCI